MTSTLRSSQTKLWANAILQTAQEFGPTPLTVRSGEIPPGLRGWLYRNGPGRLERGGKRVGHWFDGDGGILGIQFNQMGAIGRYRYIQTAGYQAETRSNQFLFAGYGTLPPGPWWARLGKDVKNAANTSVLALPDRLLALWEGGQPHALDLDTLETIGLDDLNGELKGLTYSAHYKRDPITGDIFNFGVAPGWPILLHLYRSDRTGKILQHTKISLDGLPNLHDFAFAGRYLIFCVCPVRADILPIISYQKSYSDAMHWQPEKGTEIIVVDRTTLQVVSRAQTEPWYQWHFANGCTEPDGSVDGSVKVAMVRFPDFQTNQNLKEVATGEITTPARATLWELRLDPLTAQVLEQREVLNRGCEFPVVRSQDVGQPWRYTYLALRRRDTDFDHRELFGAIGRFDHTTGTLTEAEVRPNCYPGEPIYAPDAQQPDQGWILTLVYDGNAHASELWIYAADRLEAGPVCQLGLPAVVPFDFHGTWRSAT